MMTSRGLRWSGQAIGIGRRRLETISTRQFSSSTIYHTPPRTNPLLPRFRTSIPKTFPQSQTARSNIIRNGLSIRFASTIPTVAGTSATTTDIAAAAAPVSNALPSDAATSAISSPDFASALDAATEFSSETLHNIPEHIGYLKELGLEYGFGPTALMEWVLEHVHVLAGTPWWVSISLTAILVRLVLLKPYIDAADNSARMATIKPITDPISVKMTAAMRAGDQDTAMALRRDLQMINKRAGIKMWKSFVPMLQVITGYGTFFILRAMSKIPVPGLETGGVLWFYNISIPDPYFIIPGCTALILHWVLRRGGEMGVSTVSPTVQTALMYGFPALSFVFTFWLPAALQLSFLVSGFISYLQATALQSEKFRQWWNLTPLPKKQVATKATPVYKGRANIALTQEELAARFQGAGSKQGDELQNKLNDIRDLKAPNGSWKAPTIITGAVKDIKGTVNEVGDSFKGIIGQGKDSVKDRLAKREAEDRKRYETKKQEELRKARWEMENTRRAERAAKKRMGSGE